MILLITPLALSTIELDCGIYGMVLLIPIFLSSNFFLKSVKNYVPLSMCINLIGSWFGNFICKSLKNFSKAIDVVEGDLLGRG